MKTIVSTLTIVTAMALALPGHAHKKAPAVYPTAILPFTESGAGVKGYGEKVSGILFAELVTNNKLMLVDRAELKKTLEEIELNLSGVVKPSEAIKVGQFTGAKVIISGTVIEAGSSLYLVAKIIGTETTRVLGAKVKGDIDDELGPLVEQLAVKVGETVEKQAGKLVAEKVKIEDRIKAIKKALGKKRRPSVRFEIEERHVGRATVDPAAQTELGMLFKETGFNVLDGDSVEKADVTIKGEGMSEFAMRRGNLISVKGRLELKAIDNKTNRVIAIDRQNTVTVDLTEQIAGKNALQEAAALIAERMFVKLVK
jgi:TolB-like protein